MFCLKSAHSSAVQTPLSTHCVLSAWSNKSVNLLRKRSTNLENFNSSRVISPVRPNEKPEVSGFKREIGTLRDLYSFFSKY